MKIGIVTLNGYYNYGNRLQNYALQNFIESLSENIEVETLWYKEDYSHLLNDLKTGNFLRKYIMNRRGFRNFINERSYVKQAIREYEIRKFSKKYIKTKLVKDVKVLNQEYDYFIAGSDQVWNIGDNDGNYEFLQFASKSKRISYAASFGVSELFGKPKEKVAFLLKGMSRISVREQAGADIIKNLIGLDVPVLMDPTLLLSKSNWNNLMVKPWWYDNDGYILKFFLGDDITSREQQINDVSRKYGLKVIDILDNSNVDQYACSPEEFLYLIKNASIVFTDSFHATVFSIIMNTPFINYSRKGMNSRIDTLLNLFCMSKRHVEDRGKLDGDLFDIDFSMVDCTIDKEREKSKQFLMGALNLL